MSTLQVNGSGSTTNPIASQAPAIHDFSGYLREARAWHNVMDNEPKATDGHGEDSSGTSQPQNTSTTLRTVRRSVPNIFFSENFDVEDPTTFHAACPVGEGGEGECITVLEGHLDMVRQRITSADILHPVFFCDPEDATGGAVLSMAFVTKVPNLAGRRIGFTPLLQTV